MTGLNLTGVTQIAQETAVQVAEKSNNVLTMIYEDISNKVLPTIADGATITFEYFLDVFSRYIYYYISLNVLTIIGIAIAFWIMWRITKKINQYWKMNNGYKRFEPVKVGVGLWWVAQLIFTAILVPTAFSAAKNTIKAVYIPELVVYEQLNEYTNQNDLNPFK